MVTRGSSMLISAHTSKLLLPGRWYGTFSCDYSLQVNCCYGKSDSRELLHLVRLVGMMERC